MTTIVTEEGRRLMDHILYGEEPLTFMELIFRPGFIKLMSIIWSPIILILMVLLFIHLIEKKKNSVEI